MTKAVGFVAVQTKRTAGHAFVGKQRKENGTSLDADSLSYCRIGIVICMLREDFQYHGCPTSNKIKSCEFEACLCLDGIQQFLFQCRFVLVVRKSEDVHAGVGCWQVCHQVGSLHTKKGLQMGESQSWRPGARSHKEKKLCLFLQTELLHHLP